MSFIELPMGFYEDLKESDRRSELIKMKRRILDYVLGFYQSQYCPISSNYVHKRFGPLLHRLGFRWMDIIDEMKAENHLHEMYDQRGCLYYMPRFYWDKMDRITQAEIQDGVDRKTELRKKKNKMRKEMEESGWGK